MRNGFGVRAMISLAAWAGMFGTVGTGCRRRTSEVAPPAASAPPKGTASASARSKAFTLPGIRRALKTKVFGRPGARAAAPTPPPEIFDKVEYPAPLGRNVAFVTPVKPGARRAAMIWIAGGFDWSVYEGFWAPAPRENDQTARVFREAGLVLMLPSLRGGNQNPGRNECFLGEVDDILAAADFLATRADVDPGQIYLGGHSTGATMVLLVAESTDRFRAVFSFGPVADVRAYGDSGCLPVDAPDEEVHPRYPIAFLSEIRTPTFVIEGEGGNTGMFPPLREAKGAAPVQFVEVPGADHFSVLAPGGEAVAAAVLAAAGTRPPAVDEAAILARLKGGGGAAAR